MTACALCSGYAEERGNLYINRSLKLNPLPEGTKAPVRKIHRRRVPIASWCIHIFYRSAGVATWRQGAGSATKPSG